MDGVSAAGVMVAAERLRGIAHHTPLSYSDSFSRITGSEVYLKLENLQKTGSFKVRGSFNAIRGRGLSEGLVVTASAGNHGQGVAMAASLAGIRAIVVMPKQAPLTKVEATRGYAAEVILSGDDYDEAYTVASELAKRRRGVYIHAFDDPLVVEGQGTIGLEILSDLPQVDVVVVPVGGGGLVSGIAVLVKDRLPSVEIIGVRASGVAGVGSAQSSIAGTDIADGIAVKRPGSLTMPLIDRFVDNVVDVSDDEIARAMVMLAERSKLVVEGAGAVGLAAMLSGKIKRPGKNVALVISGGNVDINFLARVFERGLVEDGRYTRFSTVIKDRPGALKDLLSLIAVTEANVVSISHDRLDPGTGIGQAEVTLAVETRNKGHRRELIELLSRNGFPAKIH